MQPALTPERIDEAHSRELTRLLCLYAVDGGRRVRLEALERPESVLDLGRFSGHFEAAVDLPRMVDSQPMSRVRVETAKGYVTTAPQVRIHAFVVPHSAVVLGLVVDFEADAELAIVALQQTCFHRESLTLDGQPVIDVFRNSLEPSLREELGPLSFGRDVHQILMPGTVLRAELTVEDAGVRSLDAPLVTQLVYRDRSEFTSGTDSLRWPVELNRPAKGFCAHARGVCVLAGASAPVEAALALTAAELVAASARHRSIRARAAAALRAAESIDSDVASASGSRLGAMRAQLARLSRRLGELELDLSFGVEIYLDALHVPEIVLESYRLSLARSLGLTEGVGTTSQQITRLKGVLEARQIELDAVQARIDEIRQKRRAVALGYVSLVAIPISLILAFLGSNIPEVSSDRSIRDFGSYGAWYGLIVGVLLVGVIFYLAAWVWSARRIPQVIRTVRVRDDGDSGPGQADP